MKKQEKHIISTIIIILLCLILAAVGIYFLLPEEYKTNKDFYSYSFVEETEIKTLYENYTSDTDSTSKNKETENSSVKNKTDADQNSVTVKEKTTKASSTTKPQQQITTKPVTTKISPSIKLSKSSVTINEGESFKLSATTVPYSTTVSWRSNNTSVATVTQSGNVKGVKEGNVTIYAEITYNGTKYSASCLVKVNNTDCTLSFNSNGGSAVSVQTVKKGSKISLPNPTKSYSVALNANGGSLTSSQYTKYCTFDGWYENPGLNGTKYTAGSSYTVTENKTLYAKWINPTLGNINSAARDGYTFLGWYTAKSGGTKYTSMSSVSGNITLFAQWQVNPSIEKMPDVTLYMNGGSKKITPTVTPSNVSVTWESSNTSIVTVNNGNVSPVAPGTARITASISYGGQTVSQSFNVTIPTPEVKLSSYSGSARINIQKTGTQLNNSTVGWAVSLPSVTSSNIGGTGYKGWELISGSAVIDGFTMYITQPGTVRVRYKNCGYYSDVYTFTLTLYKHTSDENIIRKSPGESSEKTGKHVPTNYDIEIQKFQVDPNGCHLWGYIDYNGTKGWITCLVLN